MTVLRFNPLTNASRLQDLGFTQEQAREIAQQQAELVNNELVTKDYLKASLSEMRMELQRNIFGMLVVFGIIQHFIK